MQKKKVGSLVQKKKVGSLVQKKKVGFWDEFSFGTKTFLGTKIGLGTQKFCARLRAFTRVTRVTRVNVFYEK